MLLKNHCQSLYARCKLRIVRGNYYFMLRINQSCNLKLNDKFECVLSEFLLESLAIFNAELNISVRYSNRSFHGSASSIPVYVTLVNLGTTNMPSSSYRTKYHYACSNQQWIHDLTWNQTIGQWHFLPPHIIWDGYFYTFLFSHIPSYSPFLKL